MHCTRTHHTHPHTQVLGFVKSDLAPALLGLLSGLVDSVIYVVIFLLYLLASPLATGVSKNSLAYDVDENVRLYIKLKGLLNLVRQRAYHIRIQGHKSVENM